jgi:hypothetical protein
MTAWDDRLTCTNLWNLAEWRQRLCPRLVLHRQLLDDIRMLRCDVVSFPRIRLEIEQLPVVLLILLVQPPIVPANCDQVSAYRVVGLTVKLKQVFVSVTGPLACQIRKQVHAITVLGNRLDSQRRDRGIEVKICN